MKKIIRIDGMNCSHCAAKVAQTLGAMDGVNKVTVVLKKKCAIAKMHTPVSDEALKDAVNSLGFQAISVEEKKGLFG